jgi:hypothetical protein
MLSHVAGHGQPQVLRRRAVHQPGRLAGDHQASRGVRRTLYHAGLRSDEAALLDRPDVHFNRGPFGKLRVRFGKAARTSGPRPRWVPRLDGLDLVLRWIHPQAATHYLAGHVDDARLDGPDPGGAGGH